MTYAPVDIEVAVKRECRRRRYSERTVKTYIYCINRFLKFADKTIDRISKKDVRMYLEHLSENGMAGNTMNVYHMAIRFLFEDVLDKRIWIDIRYSKVPEKIPIVLTREAVKKLFSVIDNPKHRLMMQLLYSAGLRVSELINMRISDIELDKNYGWVRGGKGNKDRLFIVADSLKDELRKFMGSRKTEWLFNSERGGKYNMRNLQEIIKKAAKEAGIKNKVSPHTLRHSFATHLIEDGYSVTEVQSLLGHKSPETTFIYLHTASPSMTKMKSPIDNL